MGARPGAEYSHLLHLTWVQSRKIICTAVRIALIQWIHPSALSWARRDKKYPWKASQRPGTVRSRFCSSFIVLVWLQPICNFLFFFCYYLILFLHLYFILLLFFFFFIHSVQVLGAHVELVMGPKGPFTISVWAELCRLLVNPLLLVWGTCAAANKVWLQSCIHTGRLALCPA